jgi:RNA polymerase sigma-70 factor (ECF subfamily)
LLTITGNVSKDLVKARTRRPSLVAAPVDPQAGSTGGGVELVLLRDYLRSALAGISDHHRTAVAETILLDRSYADVAAEYRIKPGTLRTRVHYALQQLRTELGCLDVAC